MNRVLLFFILFSFCFQNGIGTELQQTSNKVLILYLSRTNNTKAVAEMIQQKVGGDLVALELEIPYPEDYDAIVRQVAEENASGYLPPLKTKVDTKQYNTVFLGFPTWGMQLPPPMKSFLSRYDLKGKTVIPFNTNAGYGIGRSFKQMEELCTECSILEGFTTKGGIERDGVYLAIKERRKKEVKMDITYWLSKIKILNKN